MKKLQCILFVLLAVMNHTYCLAKITKLPSEDRKILEDQSRFKMVLSTTNLPKAIVALCADPNGKLAEPGKKWQETDVIEDESLPRKRLIWAAIAGDYYVVHYEHGGRGHGFHVLVARLAKDEPKPKIIWQG